MTLEELPIVRALHGEVVRGVDLLVKTGRGKVLLSTSANPVYTTRARNWAPWRCSRHRRAACARGRDSPRPARNGLGRRSRRMRYRTGPLLMYAQPIIDLTTGETVLEELLLRMRSRDGTIVGPHALLTAAERHGTVTAVDEWVFAQAAQAAAEGRAVTVDVSSRTVGQSAYLEVVEHTLERDSVEPSLITFEITEAVVSDIVGATRFASRLEVIGCHFALDDFGTGYAALTYLKHLPIRYLKIDIDFVRDLLVNERSRAVVSGVVALAAGFGQRTIAEGVEDAATLALLRELGVDLAQGFHLGRPAPIALEGWAPASGATPARAHGTPAAAAADRRDSPDRRPAARRSC